MAQKKGDLDDHQIPPYPQSRPQVQCALRSFSGITHLDNLPTAVIATMRADAMGCHHLVALGAFHHFGRADRIMGAAATPFPLAQFTFWMRNHFYFLLKISELIFL
jgi:hypothetical protein